MTPQAERLREAVAGNLGSAMVLRPSMGDLAEVAIATVVSELGITEEMVESVKASLPGWYENGVARGDGRNLRAATDALSALMEVGNE